jgi:hypothetical protein
MQSLMTCCDLCEELRMPMEGNAPRAKAVSQEGLVRSVLQLKMSFQMFSCVMPALRSTSSWHAHLSLATSSSVGSSSSLTWSLHSGLLRWCGVLDFGSSHFGQGRGLLELDMAGLVAGKVLE